MRGKTLSFILAFLYLLVIPWYIPQTKLSFFGFPLWIWIVISINIGIACVVSIYLLTNNKKLDTLSSSAKKGSSDD